MTFPWRNRTVCLVVFFIFGISAINAQVTPPPQPSYGNNSSAGNYVRLNGIRMYYETYGKGTPMVLIHDNGGDIRAMQKQIQSFSTHHSVIVADSRGHGKSLNNGTRLTYELMASDWLVLLDSLHVDSVDVFGWGNGGTIGLLMAEMSPFKIRRLAVLSATIDHDSTALTGWFRTWVATTREFSEKKLAEHDSTQNWPFMIELLDLLGNQPQISVDKLRRITAPTLVMCGDRDIVTNEHTVKIFENIPNAHLCIIPGSTHMLPWENPDVLNNTIDEFFHAPFTRPDTKEYY